MYTACKSIIITSLFLATSLQGAYHPELISHNPHLKQRSNDLVVDRFKKTISKQIKSPYIIEAFLYLLASNNDKITNEWEILRNWSGHTHQDCFEIICNHIRPLPGTFYFSHFSNKHPHVNGVYPLIIEHASPLHKEFSTECSHLIGPAMTTYLLAAAVKKFPTFLCSLYNLGYANLPKNFESIDTSMRTQLLPYRGLDHAQCFATHEIRTEWKENILKTNNTLKIVFLINMRQKLMNGEMFPEHILRYFFEYLPRVMQMQQF